MIALQTRAAIGAAGYEPKHFSRTELLNGETDSPMLLDPT